MDNARPDSLSVRQAESARALIPVSRVLNRLKEHIDGETELSATQVQAAKILLDKSLPSLQSADITAHSSPQIESEEALQGKLLELIRSNPLLIRELAKALGPHALPGATIEHDTPAPQQDTGT